MENVKYFFEELIRTEQASKLLASMKKPETEEQALHCYVELARELGCALTVEDITAYFAAQNPRTEVDEEELAQVAGGADGEYCKSTLVTREMADAEAAKEAGHVGHESCKSSFLNHENCWWNDGCDYLYHSYHNYFCQSLKE